MENRVNKVKRELRALKKGAHAIERLIAIQGTHFTRIEALSKLEQTPKIKELIGAEEKLIASLKINEEIEKNAELEGRYSRVLESLPLADRAMLLDCYVSGSPYWRIGMEYGFSEEGARKHLDRIVKKIAKEIGKEE